ncbi:MAG: septum formation initiator family protein [Chitinophagales bacterium]
MANYLMENTETFRQRLKRWKVPSILLNKYVFTLFVFGVWMTFFDQNNFIRQYHRLKTLNEAKSQIAFYIKETGNTKKQLNELLNSQEALEKFAREKYYMKKPDEDVFVIMGK